MTVTWQWRSYSAQNYLTLTWNLNLTQDISNVRHLPWLWLMCPKVRLLFCSGSEVKIVYQVGLWSKESHLLKNCDLHAVCKEVVVLSRHYRSIEDHCCILQSWEKCFNTSINYLRKHAFNNHLHLTVPKHLSAFFKEVMTYKAENSMLKRGSPHHQSLKKFQPPSISYQRVVIYFSNAALSLECLPHPIQKSLNWVAKMPPSTSNPNQLPSYLKTQF